MSFVDFRLFFLYTKNFMQARINGNVKIQYYDECVKS